MRFMLSLSNMPLHPRQEKEGWDVLQYARKLHSDTRVIIATAYQEPEVEMRSIALGAFGYMNKLQDDLIEQTRKIVLDALHAT